MNTCGCLVKLVGTPDAESPIGTKWHTLIQHCPLHDAAPELLQACKLFLQAWHELPAKYCGEFTMFEAHKLAQAAIAKASV